MKQWIKKSLLLFFIAATNNKTLMPIDGKQHNWPMTFEELAVSFPNLLLGGFYPGPNNCRCRSYNAIVIPYRDRETHLRLASISF